MRVHIQRGVRTRNPEHQKRTLYPLCYLTGDLKNSSVNYFSLENIRPVHFHVFKSILSGNLNKAPFYALYVTFGRLSKHLWAIYCTTYRWRISSCFTAFKSAENTHIVHDVFTWYTALPIHQRPFCIVTILMPISCSEFLVKKVYKPLKHIGGYSDFN